MDQYRIARDGVEVGVYDLETVRRYLGLGNLRPTDHAWKDGMDGWKTLAELNLAVPAAPAPKAPPVPDCCPNCGSDNIRTARAIHMAGTSTSMTTGSSFGGSSSLGSPRRTSRRSWFSHRVTSSKLAEELAPPQPGLSLPRIKQAIWILISLPFPPLFLLTWIPIVKLNKSPKILQAKLRHERALAEYERTWYCSKCGKKFVAAG